MSPPQTDDLVYAASPAPSNVPAIAADKMLQAGWSRQGKDRSCRPPAIVISKSTLHLAQAPGADAAFATRSLQTELKPSTTWSYGSFLPNHAKQEANQSAHPKRVRIYPTLFKIRDEPNTT